MNKRGISFILVMVMLLVMSSVGLAFVYWLYPEIGQAVKQRDTIVAMDACQSATQWAIAQLKNSGEDEVEGGFSQHDNRYELWKRYWSDDIQNDPLDPPVKLKIRETGLTREDVNRLIEVEVTVEEQYSTIAPK